jgi:hypothetical protein
MMTIGERVAEKVAAWETLTGQLAGDDEILAATQEAELDIDEGIEGQTREEILQQ